MTGIIDGHHHIWRQADLPWLQGPMVPRIFGPYEPIRRDYPIEEFLADIAGTGVEKSIYVQTNWAKSGAVDEVAWVQATADAHGWPHAIVGYTDLLDDGAGEVLKRQSAFPLMRGVRMQLHWHENPQYRFAPRPDLMNDAAFRRNLRRLADYGWSFDLQVFAAQMADAARLAADNPDITFVLQHCGMPDDLTPAGRSAWREGMRRLADQPNVVNKLSGLGTFIHRNDPAHVREIVAESVEAFGPGRCLFGSNFPIEKIWTTYRSLIKVICEALEPFAIPDQRAMLSGTAARVYRV